MTGDVILIRELTKGCQCIQVFDGYGNRVPSLPGFEPGREMHMRTRWQHQAPLKPRSGAIDGFPDRGNC